MEEVSYTVKLKLKTFFNKNFKTTGLIFKNLGTIVTVFGPTEIGGNEALAFMTSDSSLPQVGFWATDNRLSIQVRAAGDVVLLGLYGKIFFNVALSIS